MDCSHDEHYEAVGRTNKEAEMLRKGSKRGVHFRLSLGLSWRPERRDYRSPTHSLCHFSTLIAADVSAVTQPVPWRWEMGLTRNEVLRRDRKGEGSAHTPWGGRRRVSGRGRSPLVGHIDVEAVNQSSAGSETSCEICCQDSWWWDGQEKETSRGGFRPKEGNSMKHFSVIS